MGAADASDPLFAEPLQAERATLDAYGADELRGKYGFRIELAPIKFSDPDLPDELDAEMLLEYLALPSVDAVELEHTRFVPRTDEKPPFAYEGSVYFLGQHNWVDLKEIRFLEARGDAIATEFDLVIHLPTAPPREYPLVLPVETEIKAGREWIAEPPRDVEGLGTFVQADEDAWKCDAEYYGRPVRVELSTDSISFVEIARHAHFVVVEKGIPLSEMRADIQQWLKSLVWKFEMFNVKPEIDVEAFVPRSFYFYRRRHHKEIEAIVVLDYPQPLGHWSLSYTGTEDGILQWTPPR